MARIFELDSVTKQRMQDALDDLHDLKVKNCRLIYPPKWIACANCTDPIGKKPSNRYMHGGPIPFPNASVCSVCNGTNKKAVPQEEVIQLAIEWSPAQWTKVGDQNIRLPDGVILTKGYIALLPKIRKAIEMIAAIDIEGLTKYRYKLYGEPIDRYSIFKYHYFEAYWERIA